MSSMIRADGAACAVCQIAPQHGRDRWDTLEEAAGSASKTMRTAWTAGLVLLIATTARADPTEPDDLPDPRPEIARNEPRVALPGSEIKAGGYVISIYDCAAALVDANPQATRAQIVLSIRQDAGLCPRLWFYLGDTAAAAREASIWVVDVPRRQARLERDTVSDEEFVRWLALPRIALGDYVVVTGTWTTRSPHNDHASKGLLVYHALEHAAPTRPAQPATAPVRPATPEAAVATRPALRKIVAVPVFNASVDHLNACNRQNAAGHHDAAIAECGAALAIWNDNHLAWY